MSKHLVFDVEKLHTNTDEVNPIDAQSTVAELIAKLKKYKDLYALSAPQLGINERVICIKYNDGVIKEYINPIIVNSEGLHFVREKDVSMPDREFIHIRPNKIYVRYQLKDAKPEENILKDAVAEVFDRMMDYLLGFTPADFGLELDELWDQGTDEERAEVLKSYATWLKEQGELAQSAVEEDKDAKELSDAIRFMEGVDNGTITLGDPSLFDMKAE